MSEKMEVAVKVGKTCKEAKVRIIYLSPHPDGPPALSQSKKTDDNTWNKLFYFKSLRRSKGSGIEIVGTQTKRLAFGRQ